MSLKTSLVLMTVIAVVSDSMLHPFYPQYFSMVFGVSDPRHVGFYIAACSLTVMLAFPVWAQIARRVHVLHLLIATQVVTGALSLWCSALDSLAAFWGVSLAMMVFKASYLLIYPYAMSLEHKRHHIGTISLLAFVVYFGNILAALASGAVFELLEPRSLFVVMACGDALQILVCLYMLRLRAFAEPAIEQSAADGAEMPALPRTFVYRLGVVMFVLYGCSYLTEPYFSSYWEALAAHDNRIVSGFVFAIPGIAALGALFANSRVREEVSPYQGIVPAVVLGIAGLWLQLSGHIGLVLIGRFVYGWALFQSMVRLDLLMFRISRPDSYAVDFSKLNLCQGLGVLVASFSTGSLVASVDMRIPFVVAAVGFGAVVVMYAGLFRTELGRAAS